MDTINLLSPAKLNIFLHIYQKRNDGYHDLDTLFKLINLFDFIKIKKNNSSNIKIVNSAKIPQQIDICYRAAKLLQRVTNTQYGAVIQINKHIPIGGGLGGGSSNAASVLVGLNHLWGTGLNQDELQKLGLSLGSDVPFFIYGRTARATGRGEVFIPYENKCSESSFYVVARPKISVSTKQIFNSKNLYKRELKDRDLSSLPKFYQNDFEIIVLDKYPEIKRIKDKMDCFSLSYLTGTGSCLYSILDDKEKADKMVLALKQDCDIITTQTMSESPILKFI